MTKSILMAYNCNFCNSLSPQFVKFWLPLSTKEIALLLPPVAIACNKPGPSLIRSKRQNFKGMVKIYNILYHFSFLFLIKKLELKQEVRCKVERGVFVCNYFFPACKCVHRNHPGGRSPHHEACIGARM